MMWVSLEFVVQKYYDELKYRYVALAFSVPPFFPQFSSFSRLFPCEVFVSPFTWGAFNSTIYSLLFINNFKVYYKHYAMQYCTDPSSIRVYYRGNKYDVPLEFAKRMHPGGSNILMRYKDCDITKDFEKMNHSADAAVMLDEWLVDGNRVSEVYGSGAFCKTGEEEGNQQKRESDKTKRWNRLAIAFGLASIVAAVQMRKH
ncbi:hypothetical protein, unknown function [Leishmania tarentolae]|uniref:Cytochrome b5 heme-binding domain-containing protein n=1 Tax=Leishmania tarentolae TaxID=5689 RepID=A0A640KAH7_LEITA|nr:hypothetical protein, unknown function [Leishmania tarentolae]